MANHPNIKGEVYLEFQVVGHSQRVTVIDAATGLEATVIEPKAATRDHMTNLAVKKLNRRILQEQSPS